MLSKINNVAAALALLTAVAQAVPNPFPAPTPASDYQRRLEPDQVNSIISVVTGQAGSVLAQATGIAGSAIAQVTSIDLHNVTSLAPGIIKGIESIGGGAFTVITSLGGEALTLAEDGAGVVTSKFGSVFTNIATAVIDAEPALKTILPNVIEKVTSLGGEVLTVVTSIGGEALTLAESGKGVATSKFGTVFNVAAPTSTSPAPSNTPSAARALSGGAPLALGLAAVFISTMFGAAIVL